MFLRIPSRTRGAAFQILFLCAWLTVVAPIPSFGQAQCPTSCSAAGDRCYCVGDRCTYCFWTDFYAYCYDCCWYAGGQFTVVVSDGGCQYTCCSVPYIDCVLGFPPCV